MGAERAFVYAAACGIIAKSFVESRLARLSGITSKEEFDALVPDVNKSISQIRFVIGSFPQTPEILSRLFRSYEYADLKAALSAIRNGGPAPLFTDIGRFSTVRFSAYPNVHAMLRGTEFEFILKENFEQADSDGGKIDALLDKQYYKTLLDSLRKLPAREVPAFRHIICEEISLLNCSWALRLRSYYNMKPAEIRKTLIDEKLEKNGRSLAKDAIASFEPALNHKPEWDGWKRAAFLNPEQPGVYWKCDPRHFQNAASIYLYKLAAKSLRRNPFTLDTAAAFIRLKQFEGQVLSGIAEGLKFNVGADGVLEMMGGAP